MSQSTDSTQPETVSNKTELLDYTFTFITQHNPSEELNPLLAGYFSKLINSLLNYNKKKFHSYLYNTPGLMGQLINFIGNKSISEFVTKVLQLSPI